MASCTKIPVTIPKDRKLTKPLIKEVIGTFFPKEWAKVDAEALNLSYTSGYANINCIVERPKLEDKTYSEPLKVFLKINGVLDGEIAIFKHLVPTKHEEAQLCYEYGESGLGAKLYGFFETEDGTFGRVDEYLDARNLKPTDVEDKGIRTDVAKAYAAFHSMATKLEKKPVQEYYDGITRELTRYHKMERLKTLAKEGGVDMDDLVDYDFVSRIRRITEKLDSIGGKKGWCIHDVQNMNTLVRNNPKQDEPKVVLIDFEFVFQNYRGFDIGGHWMQKIYQWFEEDTKLADCRPYTEEEKRHFCDEYAKQWSALTGDADTGEQVLMEAELGFMLASTFDIHNMLNYMDEQGDKDPTNIIGLNTLFEGFAHQYKKLGLEGYK